VAIGVAPQALELPEHLAAELGELFEEAERYAM
jgi:hypothetical protein